MENSIKSTNSTNTTQILEEKTGLDKFLTDIKDSVFQVLYLVLKDEDNTFIGVALNTSLDYLQMLSFTFNDMISEVWQAQSFLNYVFDFFAFFNFTSYFRGAITWTYYVIAFYGCLLSIVAIIVNIIYVSISFSRKRVSIIWPVVLLRSVTSLFVTVLFLPITESMISMIQCQYDSQTGKFVHSMYNDIECWKGTHIIHGSLTVLMSVIFIVVCVVVGLTYFESRMLTEDPMARQHSHGDIIFLINKIVLQVSFSFFPILFTDQNTLEWAITTIVFAGGFMLYYVYNFTEPFYRKEISMLFKILTTYYLWTCGLLLLSKILSTYGFNGGLIAWLIGIPFIGVIMITSPKSRVENLLSSTSKFKTAQQLQDHVRFLLQIIDYQKIDNNAYIMLVGYIEKHKDSCRDDDCPLRMRSYSRRKAVNPEDKTSDEMDELNKRLLTVIDRMYGIGIKKFKHDPALKMSYAFFLYERIRNKKKALLQCELANQLTPNFETQFVIYRLKRLITDGLSEESTSTESGGLDLVGMIAYENFLTLCEDYMKQSAALHKDFWMELREEKPDLKKLNNIGTRVNNAIVNTQEYYMKLQKVNNKVPQVLKIYGRFLMDIKNEYEEGASLILKAVELEKKKEIVQVTKNAEQEGGDIEMTKEPLPYVVVNGDSENLGKIQKVNMLFVILTGMSKDEILNKKIDHFVPDTIGLYHNAFMKHCISKEDEYQSLFLNMDNELYIKNKSNYIVPVTIKVKMIEDQNSNLLFMGTFRPQTHKRTYVYLITRKDGTIMDLSASAISILGSQAIKKSRTNIDEIVPNCLKDAAFREGKNYLHRTRDDTLQMEAFPMIAFVTPLTLRDKANQEALNMIIQENRLDNLAIISRENALNGNNSNNNSISASMQSNTGPTKRGSHPSSGGSKRGSNTDCMAEDAKNDLIYGYIIRLEKSEIAEISGSSKLKAPLGSSIFPSSNKHKFKLYNQDSIRSKPDSKSLIDKSFAKSASINSSHAETISSPDSKKNIKDTNALIAGFYTTNEKLELTNLFSQKIKYNMEEITQEKKEEKRVYIEYGQGINIKRLYGGEIRELKTFEEENQEEGQSSENDEENEKLLNQEGGDDLGNLNVKKKDKLSVVRKLVRESLEDSSENDVISRLKHISYIWILATLVIAVLQQIYANQLMSKYLLYPRVLLSANERIYELTSIISYVIDLATINAYSPITTAYPKASQESCRTLIKQTIKDIIDINKDLSSDDLYGIMKKYEENYIPIDFIFDNGTYTDTYMQTQAISVAYNLSNADLSIFTMDNSQVMMVIKNINDILLTKLLAMNKQILSEFIYSLTTIESKFIILLSVLVFFSFCSIFVITYLLFQIESQKEDILLLFIEIPLSSVEEISKKRDHFMEFYDSQKNNDKKKETDSVDSFDMDRIYDDINPNMGTAKGIFDTSLKKGHAQALDEMDEDARKARKKMLKQYKGNRFSRSKHLLFTSAALFIFSVLYAIFNYAILIILMTNLTEYIPQFNSVSLLTSEIQDSINSNRILALNSSFLLEGVPTNQMAYNDLIFINSLAIELKEFYKYSYDKNNDFSSQFVKFFYGNACQYLATDAEARDCINSFNKSLSAGIINTKEQIFKLLRNNYVDFSSVGPNLQNISTCYQMDDNP